MKRFSLSVLALFLLLTQSKAQVTQQDSLALISINNTTLSVGWTQKWIRTNPVGTWPGVTIANGRVTGINLQGNNLAGSLNSANIAKLTKLKVLNLSHNSIGGSIPAGIGSLTELEQLNLSFNAFTGTTPSGLFNNLQQLTHVNFANNNISGWFPSSVSNATALAEINFANNAMTNKIPTTINNLTLLTKFIVNNNKLIGPFPTGKLCSATVQVDVSSNQFNFTGLECLGANPNATYNNQEELPLTQSALKLSVAAGGTLTNNTYTWYRNNGNAPYFVSTGVSNKLTVVATGNYWAKITNASAPGLTLHSDTISLTVNSLATDSLALVDFYNGITSGLNWTLTNPVDTWEGIYVEGGRVRQLEAGNITGTLSNTLGDLSALEILNLWGNISGNFPTSVANLSKLTHLGISSNSGMTGNLPDNLGQHQQQLDFLSISAKLTGTIPSGLQYATNLSTLELAENQLTGTLPSFLSNLPLYALNLRDNKLTGTFPEKLSSLNGMSELTLSHNLFTGSIPKWMKNKAVSLDLSHNQLSGPLPDSIGDYGAWVFLSNNKFTGQVPILTGMDLELDLSNNLLESVVSSNCGANMSYPGRLNLSNNKLNFTGLECLKSISGLEELIISPQANLTVLNDNATLKVIAGGTPTNNTYKWYKGNTLVGTKNGDSTFTYTETGTYHALVTNSAVTGVTLYSDTVSITALGSLKTDSLALVDFYNGITSGLNWVLTNPVSTWEGVTLSKGRVDMLNVDQLSGTLSSSLGNLSELTTLYLGYFGGNNNLTGSFPSAIVNLTKLRELGIDGSNMTGTLPDDLGRNQPHLFLISLGGRYITGAIPSGLEYASSLTELYIGGSQISGTIPTFFKKLPLFNLELSGNQLTGTIPDSLSSNEGLSSLVLANNKLTGTIPSTIRAIFVDLSNNQLSGPLPDSVAQFGAWIRLNNNKFTGRIPDIRGSYLELDISNNNLGYVDPVNCGPSGTITADRLNISNNKLNFTALECVQSSAAVPNLTINPQQRIPIINENPVLKAAAGGTLANNTYRWLRNTGTFVTKVGDSTLTITTPGVYACIVTNSAVPGVELRTHNANISTVSSRKMQPASPDDLAGAIPGKLSVYPNPTGNDFIYIKGLHTAESILLYNAAGQLVKQWQNVNGGQQLNIGSITNGVYMVKVVEKDKQTMLKFIKQ